LAGEEPKEAEERANSVSELAIVSVFSFRLSSIAIAVLVNRS